MRTRRLKLATVRPSPDAVYRGPTVPRRLRRTPARRGVRRFFKDVAKV